MTMTHFVASLVRRLSSGPASILVFLFAMLASGCLGGAGEEELATMQNELLRCENANECSLEIPLVNGVKTQETALIASGDLVIGDNARVQDSMGTPLPVVNAGEGVTRVGSGARVGKIVSYAPTVLERGAFVTGDVVSARRIQARGAHVTGQKLERQDLGAPGHATWPVLYPATSAGNVEVGRFRTQTVAPGRYGRLEVNFRGTLRLTTGTYYLDSIDVGRHATLELDNSQGMVVVYVRHRATLSGTLTQTGARGDFLLGYLGRSDVVLDTPAFVGSIVAPKAKLRLGSHRSVLEGLFIGGRIEVERGATIKLLHSLGEGPAGEALSASVIVDPPDGTPSVPTPTDWGDTHEEWAQIFGAYIDALIAAGYNGPAIVVPTPSFGLSSSVSIPPVGGATVVSGPGGLNDLADNIPGFGLLLGPDDAPPPSQNHVHFQFPEDGPGFFGNDEFAGGFFLEGDLDANQVRQAGFYTHVDGSIALKGRVFGYDFDAARVVVWEHSETEHVNSDGSTKPVAEVGAQVFLGPLKVTEKKKDTIGLHEENLVEDEASILPPGVPPPIPIGGFITLQAGAKGKYSVNLKIELAAAGPIGTLTPKVGVYGTASASVELVAARVILEFSLALIEVSAPVDLRLRWSVNETPEVCRADIEWDAGFKFVWRTLHGELHLKIEIGFDFGFWDAHETIADIKLLSFDILPEVSTPRVSLVPDFVGMGIKSFPLDQQQCQLGSLLCARAGIPGIQRDTWGPHDAYDSGFTGVGANYGQAACPDQFLIELALQGERPGAWISGNWSLSMPADACNEYEGVITVFGLDNMNQWVTLDQLKTQGELSSGVCSVVVVSRLGELPPDANPEAPYSYVPPGVYSKMRAAIFAGQSGQKIPMFSDYYWPTP